MAINKEIPYAYRRDIPFDLKLDDYGDLKMLEDTDAVNQSIYAILMSNFGDKNLENIFGADMESMIFENAFPTNILIYEIESKIRDSIENSEPNINILGINVDVSRINNYEIHITMAYSLNDGITTGIFDEDLSFANLSR